MYAVKKRNTISGDLLINAFPTLDTGSPVVSFEFNNKGGRKFGKITEWSEELGSKFFEYYNKVFEEGALSAREKSLIALAVSHVVKCPYCIDAYTKDGLQRGITKDYNTAPFLKGPGLKL